MAALNLRRRRCSRESKQSRRQMWDEGPLQVQCCMPAHVSIHDTPIVPRLLSRSRIRAQGKIVLARLVATEPYTMSSRESLIARLFPREHPPERQLVKLLGEEDADIRVLERGAQVGDMILQPVVDFVLVGIEVQRRSIVLVLSKGRVDFLEPAFLRNSTK